MKIIKVLVTGLVLSTLAACGPATIEPATVGKVLTPAGYNKETLPPGKIWLGLRETLVTLETGTQVYIEKVPVVLSDKLTITMDIRFRGRINAQYADAMFNDIKHGGDFKFEFAEVYHTYGKPEIREIVRGIVSEYTVEDVHKNYKRIGAEISNALVNEFKSSPVEISGISLGGIIYPTVVTDAINKAKERKMLIEQEKAQNEIDILKKTNELALIKAEQNIELTKAETTAQANKIMGQSITPELLRLKEIEVQKILAENSASNTKIYVPSSMGAPTLVEQN